MTILKMQDMRQYSELNPGFWQILSNHLEVTNSELRSLIETGKIDASDASNAFKNAAASQFKTSE